jgi:hypothetical protein
MIASRYHWLSHVVFNFNLHGLLQILIDTTGLCLKSVVSVVCINSNESF